MNLKGKALFSVLASLSIAASVNAANIPVTTHITTSQTWTANNVYNLVGQIFVYPGATLRIEPGTLIKSNVADEGSLAICRGAKIIANGTPTKPIIFTSNLDTMNAPHTGVNEWGNITIMGRGFIGAHYTADGAAVRSYVEGTSPVSPYGTLTSHTNTPSPDGFNKAVMEGFNVVGTGDPKILYGGNDDGDDSGSLSYVSLRYGGKVLGLGNELNGLSLGGIGRETDIHHIDIYQNVDDGIEIWGGAVNLKYVSIWNIGDDSFDVDQGWRGKAQFGLIVQGYGRTSAAQGGGIGDNVFEMDGAEDNTAVPVTTAKIYNFTCIGQPGSTGGDAGIELRDGARVQVRNSIFMNLGENVLVEKASESGITNNWRFGSAGTVGTGFSLTFDETFQNSFSAAWSKAHPLNGRAANHPNAATYSETFLHDLYAAQTDGNLNEISDCILYGNNNAIAYNHTTNYTIATVPYTSGGFDRVTSLSGTTSINNVRAALTSPIKSITRETPVSIGTSSFYTMANVTALDPRANTSSSDITSVGMAPDDGFFTPVAIRGAFTKDVNWAKGWTAASAYNIMSEPDNVAQPVAASGAVVSFFSFNTANGVLYVVEKTTDGKTWEYDSTVAGDGTTKNITGAVGTAYRAVAQ